MRDKILKNKHAKWLLVIISITLVILLASIFSDSIGTYFTKDDMSVEKENDAHVRIQLVYAFQNSQWNDAVESIIAAFEKENPDILIDFQINYEDEVYEDVLNKLNARGELGDIVQLKTPFFYAASGVLAPVDAEVSDLVNSKYIYDDQVYGVGAIGSTVGVVYNKTLFDSLGLSEPKTYGEFLNICSTLKENSKTPIIVGGKDLWHMEFWVNHFLRMDILQNDSDWLKKCENGTVDWEDEYPGQMLNHLYDLFNSGYVDSNWMYTSDSSLPYIMSQGDAGMMYTGSWVISQIQELNPDMELGWFYLPDESGNIIVGENQDVFWAVTKECGDDELKYQSAMKFLEFFYTSEEYQNICNKMNAIYSTTKPISYESSSYIQKEVITEFYSYQDHITTYLGNENTPEGFEKKFLSLVIEMINSEKDIDAYQKLCEQYWKQYMEEN